MTANESAPNDRPLGALALAAKIKRREISAVEALGDCLRRIEADNAELNAFVEVDRKRSREVAERADALVRSGAELPIFHGVPTGIKDHELVQWMGTRAGSPTLSWVISPIDGLITKRCRAAGMTIVGKLSTSELTILPFVDGGLHPPTRNPVHRDHYSGGSSGGSSAAVASHMLSIAPGSDGAGSIRVPAAFTGLVGIKPGRGELFHEHTAADPYEISAIGPLAHDVRDAAAMLDALNGWKVSVDAPPVGSFLAACDVDPGKLRVRVGLRSPLANPEADIVAAVTEAAKALEAMGHAVDEGSPFDGTMEDFLPLMAFMIRSIPILPWKERALEPTTRWMRAAGKGRSKVEVLRAAAALDRRVTTWFGDADVWITPTTGELAPKVGKYGGLTGEQTFRAVVPIGAFTAPFNVSGQPAISVPWGKSSSGLPIGVQLVGRRGSDRKLVSLAKRLEDARPR